MALISTDEYCTFTYWYDSYGYRYSTENCSTTKTNSDAFGYNSSYTYYNTYTTYAPYNDTYSTDEYCTISYGYYGSTETCDTTTTTLDGRIYYYTDYYPA